MNVEYVIENWFYFLLIAIFIIGSLYFFIKAEKLLIQNENNNECNNNFDKTQNEDLTYMNLGAVSC